MKPTQYRHLGSPRLAGPVPLGLFSPGLGRHLAQNRPFLVTRQTPSRVLVNEAGFTGCEQVGGGAGLLCGISCGRHLRPFVSP